jgi:pimeloyl-ACP methyl ester carboxylesterase
MSELVFLSILLFLITVVELCSSSASTLPRTLKVGERVFFDMYVKPLGRNQKAAYQYFPSEKESFFAPQQPAIVCIHGFGGNADQFRKNCPVFAKAGYDSYAIDLLGYGYSDKPSPKPYPVNSIYNFENWADQVLQFINQIVRKPVILVCNSVGGVAGLQAALIQQQQQQEQQSIKYKIQELILIDISLRLLHTSKQTLLQRWGVPKIQSILRETSLGKVFFRQVKFI